jgi:predicted transcriptional regulator
MRVTWDVTDAELSVLQAIWEGGPATVRQLADALYPGGGASGYATVQKLLERLEGKGFVARRQQETVRVFEALVERDGLIGRRLQAMAETLCGGSLVPVLSQLVQTRPLSDPERRALRELIERLDGEGEGRADAS